MEGYSFESSAPQTKEHVAFLDEFYSNKKALDRANLKLKVDEDKVGRESADPLNPDLNHRS